MPMISQDIFANQLKKATFAGGCFWCMEPPFEKLAGVKSVVSGFSGGKEIDPSYQDVSQGKTGHVEAIQIVYDSERVGYNELLEIFWTNIDPTDANGQFVDRGRQYASAIFYHDDQQKRLAEQSLALLTSKKIFKQQIKTAIRPYHSFYLADDYHQDYYKKNIVTRSKYRYYRALSGRDQYLESVWKGRELDLDSHPTSSNHKLSSAQLKSVLTTLQYHVTQEDGTEPPFKNEYWDNHQEGIYVDIVTKEPLFGSRDKFDSGSGWPSFSDVLEQDSIVRREDNSLFNQRVEIRSKVGDSHLGHLFTDGPKPSGLRYCINSASLKFIKREDMQRLGYGKYLKYFSK